MLLGAGGLAVLVGGAVVVDSWYEAARFQGSPEAEQAERSLEAPTPIWIDSAPTAVEATRVPRAPRVAAVAATPAPARAPTPVAVAAPMDLQAADRLDARRPTDEPTPVPEPTEVPPRLELTASEFRFLDPPEPGAHARLTVTVHSLSTETSGTFELTLPLKWLAGYRVASVDPVPTNVQDMGGEQRISFDALDPDDTQDITVDLVATDEVLDPPAVRLLDVDEREAGRAQPPTEAPHPRPGPVWSVSLPRLHIRSGVVPVDWEPPLFVVGQLRDTPHVTEGNSVLVGHLVGSLGNVFQHLDRVNIGDEVIATSRGEQYHFVVSQKETLPAGDTTPVDNTDTPRLTLMTCAGTWNPLARDYTERLWVIAEPPDLAARTIASGAAAPHASPTPTPPPADTPTPVPPRPLTQVAGPGGLGNTDNDLARTYGGPVGEASGGLAVYHSHGQEFRAAFADTDDPPARRAVMVARVPAAGASMSLDEARKAAQALLPSDAKARGGPEGNQRFVVERFNSQALAQAVPPQGYAEGQSEPGDFLVVYARQPNGRITDIVVGIGDDAEGLLRPLGPAATAAAH